MANLPTNLDKIPVNVLQEIIEACNKSFQKELNTESFYGKGKTTWSIPEIGLVYKSTESNQELEKFIENLTSTTTIRQAYAKIYEVWEGKNKSSENLTQTPEYTINSTVPEAGTGSVQETERQYRETETQKSKKEGERQTLELIERLKKRRITLIPKEQVPSVSLTKEDKEEIYNLGKAALIDPKTTQSEIKDRISQSVDSWQISTTNKIPNGVIENCATDFTEKISVFGNLNSSSEIPDNFSVVNESSTLNAIANVNDAKLKEIIPEEQERNLISKDAQEVAIAIELNRNVNTSLLKPVLRSDSITDLFYGPETITEYTILDGSEDLSQEQEREKKEIDVGDLYDNATRIRDVWGKLSRSEVNVSESINEGTKLLPSYSDYDNLTLSTAAKSLIEKNLPTIGTFGGFNVGVLGSSWLTNGYPMLANPAVYGLLPGPVSGGAVLTQSAYAFSNSMVINSSFSFSMGNFGLKVLTGSKGAANFYAAQGTLGGKVLNVLAVKTGSSVTIGFGTGLTGGVGSAGTTAITVAGAGAGTGAVIGQVTIPIPVIGAAIGVVGGWIASKIPWNKIKDYVIAFPGAIIGVAAGGLYGGMIGYTAAFGLVRFVGGGWPSVQASLSGFGSSLFDFISAVGSATLGEIATPIISILLFFPIIVVFIIFIINSGAYVVPQGSSVGTPGITCDASKNSNSLTSDSSVANAAICIVSYLNQFNLNPLKVAMLTSGSWSKLTQILPAPATEALAASTTAENWLQCVGFASATAGFAYGKNFAQINACSYIDNAPSGYRYINGTKGIRAGDFFLINGSPKCASDSPGHIGVVISVDGDLISCADANYGSSGGVRAKHGCFALSQLAGYLRK